MTPTYGLIVRLLLFIGGIYWCFYILKRLPDDLRELRSLYVRYRNRKDPSVLATMRTQERRRNYQRDCVTEFWSTLAIQLFLFWPITVIVALFIVGVLWGAVSRILEVIG